MKRSQDQLKLQADKPPLRPHLWAVTSGLVSCLLAVAVILGRPLWAPGGELELTACAFVAFGTFLTACVSCILALREKPLRGIAIIGLLTGCFWAARSTVGIADGLWIRQFERTANLRQALITFMGSAPAKDGNRIKLSGELKQISDQPFAMRYVDPQKGLFYAYTVSTYGIDNGVGFAWSETGAAPPREAYPEITWSRPLGQGWFLFWST